MTPASPVLESATPAATYFHVPNSTSSFLLPEDRVSDAANNEAM
jgi:hypothetical protein